MRGLSEEEHDFLLRCRPRSVPTELRGFDRSVRDAMISAGLVWRREVWPGAFRTTATPRGLRALRIHAAMKAGA